MISEEIKRVLNGEYNNPALDRSMNSLLYASLISLDMTSYMNLRELRTNAILQDELVDEYNEDNGLGL